MIIRIILLSGLALIGWRVFLRRTKLPIHIVVIFGGLGLAVGAVLFPSVTTDIAHVLGVGRGADLITYLVEVSLLFVVLHYYMKFVELEEQMTQLVREIALLRAPRPTTEPRANEPDHARQLP
jgi:small membrane protein